MVLSTEWSQVEVIDLVNDGSGLGFGIVGGRSTGVVIKSILPGGIADRDSRLQSGDHILQIGDVNLRGLGSEQVATVLRQAGAQVRMVVARPVESASDYRNICSAPIVPTKILSDPDELDRHLLQNGYPDQCDDSCFENYDEVTQIELNPVIDLNVTEVSTPEEECNSFCDFELPETETFIVELKKNVYGLGITVAGYVCEREDLCGIFVKSISEGSAADKCGKIKVHDRIIEVDGESLQGYTNHQAVEKLRGTDVTVVLSLERYLRGPKYEHLQEALAYQEQKSISPPSPSVTTLSWIPVDTEIEPEGESSATIDSTVFEINPENVEIFIDANFEAELTGDSELAITKKWQGIVGPESKIVVTHLKKLKGLGISLEGTVDVEGGVELRPRHYIRSILPEGPVGQDGRLSCGDELLEVNGQRLLGIRHTEVVKILKELPSTVRIVCSRNPSESRVINTSQDVEGFAARNILGGSLKNILQAERSSDLIKALSDTSVNTSSTATVEDNNLEKAKSRSLEATNLAMWCDTVEYIELKKGDRGLGFSILDYQDPLDPNATVIVVRSLVPKGPAELDGRLKPGDRLMYVNDISLRNVTLDRAVQALKATVLGLVRIGLSKPLKINESHSPASVKS